MLDALKITQKQEALIRDIAITHEYFPELALDDLKFKNTYYVNLPMISDLIKQGFIVRKGKSLAFTRNFAKRYWDEIIHSIPVVPENKQLITKEFLDTKDTDELRKVYHTLTSKEGESLTRNNLINEIYQQFNKGEEKMVENKKETVKKAPVKKEAINDGKKTPKEIAAEAGVSAGSIRKAIRSVFGKSKEGNWRLDDKQIKQVMVEYEKQRKEAAAKRAERMKELQAKRQAKAEKKAAPAKAPAKKAK